MANDIMKTSHLLEYQENCDFIGSTKKEEPDSHNVNQDSGYHSFSSQEMSVYMHGSSKKQLSENSDHIQRNLASQFCHNQMQKCGCNIHNGYMNNGSYCQQINMPGLQNPSMPINNNIERTCATQSDHLNHPFYSNANNVEFQKATHHNTNFNQEILPKLQSTEKQKLTEDNELELKIEFCLKFGFSIEQIRTALHKIGHNAIKDDILSYLCSTYSQIGLLGGQSDEYHGSLNENYRMRGPSTVEDDKTKIKVLDDSKDLRPIIIDGSNVAMSHGSKEYFSCKGIQIAVKYFLDRNHRDITVFVPKHRREQTRADAPIKDQHILDKLEKEKILVYTPSRNVGGKRITCYDDRFILQLALETKGVIVSNDFFRDLQAEKQEWKELINKRLLMYSFVNDRFMLPDDPLGRNGPSLDNLLRKQPKDEKQKAQKCPYRNKCTYGKKCKFYHPENSHSRSVTEKLKENTRKRFKPSQEAIELAAELVQNSPVKELSDVKAQVVESVSPNRTTELKQSPNSTRASENDQFHQIQEGITKLSVNENSPYYQQKNSLSLGNYAYSTTERSNEGRPLMPPLHSANRGIMTSSTSPQQRQISANHHMDNLYHSSPPALAAYEIASQQQRQKEMLQNVPGIPPRHPAYPQNYQPYAQPYVYPMQQPCGIPQNMLLLQGQVPTSQSYNQYYQQPPQLTGHSQDSRHAQSLRMSQPPSSPPYNVQNRQVFSSPNPHGMPVHIATHQQINPAAPHPQQPFKVQGDRRFNLYKNLCALFPQPTVEKVLTLYPEESNPTTLAKLCMEF